MWIHTTNGFVSIVKHNQIPNCLLVRGRVKADLEAVLGEGYEITTEPGSDYTYRAIVDAEDVAVIIADAILDIDYTSHFKDVTIKRAPKVEHGSRSRALYAIWNAMSDLQGYRPYSKHLRTEETIAAKRHGGNGLFSESNEWTRSTSGQWVRNPNHVKGGGKAASTARATSGHYDWSQHPQSAAYAGDGAPGNVSMDKALDILDELADDAGIAVDDLAEQVAIDEAAADDVDAEAAAQLDELTEYALANFPEAQQWTDDQWETYYLQNTEHRDANTEHRDAVDAAVEPVATDADDEAKADWESLQAQEALRRGPKGGRRRQASTAKTVSVVPTKVTPVKAAPRRRTASKP